MGLTAELGAPAVAAARDLHRVMRGGVMLPTDADYLQVRRIWNGAVKHRPALIAQCETVDDVCAAVRAARTHSLPLSVRGGGHDWAGRSLRHNGLVIDLSAMRCVEVDAEKRIATVSGGAAAREVVAAADPHGLVAVTGNCGTVGLAGLTLGGGYGLLGPRYGLALDNMVGADVVLGDGRFVKTDATQHPELFWALRGGGGNFGVVTAMRVRLHPVPQVLAGLILFPCNEAQSVLRGYTAIAASAPDEFGVLAGILPTPDGTPVVFLAPMWSGDPAKGMPLVAELTHLGTPILAEVGPMAYRELLAMFDAHIVIGRHYAMKTRWLAELTPAIIADLVAAGAARTSPYSFIVVHHCRGAATRVAPESTAFGLRREHFMLEIIAAWDADDDNNGDAHQQWARRLWETLKPRALPGGYANILAPDDHDQIAMAHGENIGKLLSVKARFDPDNIFSAIPLAAAGHGRERRRA
jgi:FAD/FMN-containing dehydrogenase